VQLEMVITLLGSPQSLEDFQGVPEWAKRFFDAEDDIRQLQKVISVKRPADNRCTHCAPLGENAGRESGE
jgi:hypothetical protein